MSSLKPCGTSAAYRRHLRHNESPCQLCTDAERARQQDVRDRDRGGPPTITKNPPCGTPGAYSRHHRLGEAPCEPCRLAWNEYCRNRHKARKRGAT